MRKISFTLTHAVVACLLIVGAAAARPSTAHAALFSFIPSVYAADERSPKGSTYGEKRSIGSAQEAERAIREHFGKRKVRIGEIREREVYFEAEVRDDGNRLIDKVIVDKRTGRVRSVL